MDSSQPHPSGHPVGRQVGDRIYYGSHGEVCCGRQMSKKSFITVLTVLLLLIGFILTVVGIAAEPIWDEQDAIGCSFCRDERRHTLKNLKNCRIVGPVFIFGGICLVFYIGNAVHRAGGWREWKFDSHTASSEPALTYNQGYPLTGSSYPDPGQAQGQPYPSMAAPIYPPPPYPPQSYSSAPPGQSDIAPPPSYDEVVGMSGTNQPPRS